MNVIEALFILSAGPLLVGFFFRIGWEAFGYMINKD